MIENYRMNLNFFIVHYLCNSKFANGSENNKDVKNNVCKNNLQSVMEICIQILLLTKDKH